MIKEFSKAIKGTWENVGYKMVAAAIGVKMAVNGQKKSRPALAGQLKRK